MKDHLIKQKPIFYILIGVLLLGTGPLFVKSVDANGIVIAFFRLLFASILMAGPVFLGKQKKPLDLSAGNITWPILGGLTFAANIALWSSGLKFTTASAITLLDNTAPVWVGLFSFLILGEKRGWQYWAGLAVTLLGAAVMIGVDFFNGSAQQLTGNLIGIASGITYAAYLLVTQKARSSRISLHYSWLVSTIGAAALLVVNALVGGFQTPISLQGFFLIFLMALTSQVLAWLLVNQALGELPASISSVILVGQPVVTTILGAFFLSEVPNGIQLAGGFLCLLGIILAQRSKIRA